jgi:hypothetical protein
MSFVAGSVLEITRRLGHPLLHARRREWNTGGYRLSVTGRLLQQSKQTQVHLIYHVHFHSRRCQHNLNNRELLPSPKLDQQSSPPLPPLRPFLLRLIPG